MRPLFRDSASWSWPNLFVALGFAMLLATGGAPVRPAAAETEAETISGEARVIDADILIVAGKRVILWGIDAPERSQTCRQDSTAFDCYNTAKRALETMAGRGAVQCTLTGEPDPFGRRFGVCNHGSDDLGAEMVKLGMALAFSEQSDDYADLQLQAITDGVGLWQPGVVFVEPWEWRRSHTPGGFR